jgi:dienelactone hydrolase
MRWLWLVVCAACGGATVQGTAEPPAPGAQVTSEDVARQIVAELAAGRAAPVAARFDEAMAAAMTIEQLGELWQGLEGQIGAFQAQKAARVEKKDGFEVVTVTCAFARASVEVRVVLDAQGRIAGLFVRPAAAEESPPPPYAVKDRIVERELPVGEGRWALPGTLTLPAAAERVPAVVLVHGSGPNDRDETIGPNKPFRDLAHGLGSLGVAVLRYEKRTRYHGSALAAELGDALTVKEETIDDAVAAARALRGVAEVDAARIFVAGHSLGGTVIHRIALAAPEARGFVVLAGVTRPLEDVYLGQVEYITGVDGTVSGTEAELRERARVQVARVKTLAPGATVAARDLPLGIPVPYWLDLAAHPPTTLGAEARPILVLYGDRDYQVTAEDFAGWERLLAGKPNATLKRYPALNHLFIAGSGKSTPSEYLQPGYVAEEVVRDIAAWVASH